MTASFDFDVNYFSLSHSHDLVSPLHMAQHWTTAKESAHSATTFKGWVSTDPAECIPGVSATVPRVVDSCAELGEANLQLGPEGLRGANPLQLSAEGVDHIPPLADQRRH